ncbi:MAG: hypothetical protein JXA37_07510 [Chloroflexia bacterium]|nr:hypothetical protein [Chloroflexia bacterium]
MRVAKTMVYSLILILLLGAGLAQAQQEDIEITILPTLHQRYVAGEATMVRVQLENHGPDQEGSVIVEVSLGDGTGAYHIPLSLPRQARKEVSLVIGPLPASNSLTVSARFSSRGRTLARTSIILQGLANDVFIIGLLVDDPAPLSFLSSVKPKSTILPLRLADLPEQVWPLQNLDLLVVAGTDTSGLSTAQRQALVQWVGRGGHLLAAGGPGAELALAGLPAEILPVTLSGENTLEALPSLEQLVGEPLPVAGAVPLSTVSVVAGEAMLSEQEQPLVVVRSYGLGRVTFLSLNPLLAPLRSWAGNEDFWRRLLSGTPPANLWHRQWLNQPGQVTGALMESSELRLPSILLVAGLLLLYIILVGPVNYVVLRRRGRLERAWLTIPLLTLVFAVGVYALGNLTRGGERKLTTLAVVRMASGGPVAAIDAYNGLFSPRRQDFDLRAGPGALFGPLPPSWYGSGVSALQPLNIAPGPEPALIDLRVEQWSMRTFTVHSVLDPAPAIQGRVLYKSHTQAHVSVHNGSSTSLENCQILGHVAKIGGQRHAFLGSIAAGASFSRTVSLDPLSGAYQIKLPTEAEKSLLWGIVGYNYENIPPGLALLCHSAESPLQFELSQEPSERQASSLYLVDLELEGFAHPSPWEPSARLEQAGPVLLPWSVITSTPGILPCEEGFLPGDWEVILEYHLPYTLSAEAISALTLTLEDGDWMVSPEVHFYNPKGAWMLIEQSPPGQVRLSGPGIPPYLIDDTDPATMRVRLVAQSQPGSCPCPRMRAYGGGQ